jgi:hypothetical protein
MADSTLTIKYDPRSQQNPHNPMTYDQFLANMGITDWKINNPVDETSDFYEQARQAMLLNLQAKSGRSSTFLTGQAADGTMPPLGNGG